MRVLIVVCNLLAFATSEPMDITISKHGGNVCMGNSADFCETTWLSYPNLNAALFGIDQPSLNPVPNDFISEPGVKAQIFQATYRDETGSMAQFDFVQTIDDLRCASKFDEYFFSSFEETINGWSSFEETGRGLTTRSADVTVGIPDVVSFSTSIPPMFSRSHSESNEAAGMEQHFNSDRGSVAHSRAECSIYRVLIDIFNPTLKFYSGFESALLSMDTIARNGTAFHKKQAGIWFIDQYGTHYARSSLLGSAIAFETRYDQTETDSHDKNTLKKCATKSGARVLGIQVEDDKTECNGSLEDTTTGEDTAVKRTTQTTVGSFPAGSGNIQEWSKQLQEMAKEGTLTPSPIRRELVPIVNLLQTKAIRNIVHTSGPYENQTLDLANVVDILVPAYNEYCAQMSGTNCHLGCPEELTFYFEDSIYELQLSAFPYNEHVVYCTSSHICLYYAKGKWNFGDAIGIPESSIIQSTDCPQEGGEMVGMTQMDNSPIHGIDDWRKCTDICKNQLACNYWQWHEVNGTCWRVYSFTGFQSASNFVTGARNCPISSQSLVTLCPSKGPYPYMWRDATEGDEGFFSPLSSLMSCPASTNSSGGSWILLQGKCYLPEHGLVTNEEASSFCESKGGSLIELNTQKENDVVFANRDTIGITNNNVWIGLKGSNSQYGWESGAPLIYTNWQKDQPDGRDCVFTGGAHFTWYGQSCSYNLSAITVCEA